MEKLLIFIFLCRRVLSQLDEYPKHLFIHHKNQQRLLQSECHYSCQECDGSTEQDCLSCNSGLGRYYDSIKRMCFCEKNLFDVGISECLILNEAVPSGELSQENNTIKDFCKFGQFKVLLQNNTIICLNCPKSINNNLNCLDCYLNPDSWFKQPRCTSDFLQLKNDENYGYLMQKRQEIDFVIYFISETFSLISNPYYSYLCSEQDLILGEIDCQLMDEKHINKQLYAVCKDYSFYDSNSCILCPLFCSMCNKIECIGCINHSYLYNGLCFECPQECKECQYNQNLDIVECNQCYEHFGLVQGNCIECGLNCASCMFWKFYDAYYGKWIQQLRCIQCIDPSKYFLSSNGIDCLENMLQNCLYAYQTNSLFFYYMTTYDYKFKSFLEAISGCARCKEGYDVDEDGKCVPAENLIESCLFVFKISFEEYSCLISDYSWSQQNNQCQEVISNCQECIKESWTLKLLCIQCQPGYYAHRLFGYCIQCPEELNCRICYQQQSLFQDDWVVNIRSFYEGVIDAVYVQTETTLPRTFRTYAQSQNISDYEISCKLCLDGYQLHKNICILKCPQDCLECKIENNQNICIKCQNDQYGKVLSLVDNKCLSCPSNCDLCIPRIPEEIKKINPYFENQKYQNFTNRCVKNSNSQSFAYDPDFGYFINCELKDKLCQNILTINLKLYCDQEQYNNDLEISSQTLKNKFKFLKTTLFLDDFLLNSFQQFENDQFYSLLNIKQIGKLKIRISTQQNQDCFIYNKVTIAQLFRMNVFSLSSVNLEFIGIQDTNFYIFDTLEFHNFSSISFDSINFGFKTSSIINQQTVKFVSILQQTIEFKNLKIEQEANQIQDINIQFNNIDLIYIHDVQISNLNLNSTNGLFQFISVDSSNTGTIKFENFNIYQTNLINTKIISYEISNSFMIYLENISLNLNLMNSNFFVCNQVINFGNLIINKLKLTNSVIKNTSCLIQGNFLKLIDINSIILQQNQFDHSNLILLNNNITLQNIQIENCVLLNSYLILNQLAEKNHLDTEYLFNLKNFLIINNQYNVGTKYITIYRYTSTNSKIIFEQLKIKNNIIIDTELRNQKKQQSASIILESDEIYLKNFEIFKLRGIPDFSIINSHNLTINDLYVTSQINKEKLFLQKQSLQTNDLGIVFHIYSVKQIRFQSVHLVSLFIHNYPIIYYEQATKTLINQDGQIEVYNSKFTNNLLYQSNSQFSTNLIEIFSAQKVIINFINSTFENNIIYFQTTSTSVQSTNLLNIDCSECSVNLREFNFLSNVAINTTSSTLFIKSTKISISESVFKQNGFISKDILSFLNQIEVYFDNSLFYQGSGNGVFQTDNMYVLNCNFFNQYGSKGASISFYPLNQGFFKIENTIIDISQNYFIQENEKGGVIYISSSSANLQLEIINCQFSNIYSIQGGLIMIESPQNSIQILINNTYIMDFFSLKGSLVYVNFEEQYTDNSLIQLQDLKLSNTLEGFSKFFQLYNDKNYNLQEIEASENFQIILYKRSIIFSKLGRIQIKNLIICGLINEIIIYDQYLRMLQVNSIYITNSSISNQGLIYVAPFQNKNFSIYINSVLVENLKTNTDEIQSAYYKYAKISRQNIFGIINILNIHQEGIMEFRNIKFINNQCNNCQAGLMNFQFNNYSQNNLNIQDITFKYNICGERGCLNIVQDNIYYYLIDDQDNLRLLEGEKVNNILNYVFIIQDYYCYQNLGTYGVCLFVQNLAGQIDRAIFSQNNATVSGGAVYSFGNKSNLQIMKAQIVENYAKFGGGMSIRNHFSPNLKQYETFSFENQASYFGNDYAEYPTHLIIQINNYNQFIYKQYSSLNTQQNNIKIFTATLLNNEQEIKQILLPSAQHLYLYQQFDWENNNYIMMNYTLRLIPYDQRNNRIKNLTSSKCTIKGRLYDYKKLEESEQKPFSNNFTNLNEVVYDNSMEEYNFDHLIIYFDPDLPENIVLQFEFKCDSIRIPILNENQQIDTIIKQSKEYYLRLNIKTLPCQIGELKSEEDLSCHPCDYTQDYYSVNFNSNKCKIRDNIQMEQVKSAQIKLRPNYWRPYFYADLIEYCYNFQLNCLGGWNYGDVSCSLGHIGALCEQCDIYNIRGDGAYSISQKYKCGSCDDTKSNTLIIIGISLWTLISISISVKSTVEIIKQLARASKLKSIGIMIVVTKNNAVNFIKILTNYLQIIASISTFQLQLPQNMESTINSLGNPVETMAYSLDCFLKDMFQSISIHYSRTIWQLIMPFIYILLFLQFYGVGVILKYVEFNSCVISTSLIYMFIYFQPNIIAGQIGLLSYRTISGFKWILGNVANRYDTNDHIKWLLSFCLPVLFTFGVLIPGFLFNRLYKIRQTLKDKNNRLIWGYLYNEYKESAYYWEIVKIIQKELIIIFLTFYQDQIIVKAVLVYGIIFIYNYLTLYMYPYQSMQHNILDHQSTRVCGFSIVLAIGIYGSLQSGIIEVQIPFYIIMTIINFLFLIKLILQIIKAYFQQFEVLIDNIRDFIRIRIPSLLNYPFFQKILKNQQQTRLKAQKNFRKIKLSVILLSRQIILNKKINNTQERKGTFILDSKISLVETNQNQQKSSLEEINKNFLVIGQNQK
ncbi:unnamed protein product [Paramecium pentaurelia]|uniref:Transmembrane protein n=1 Tax=Paramecium pentaurelia TaxID=43138 RepID=A0A8S1WWW4_9CILI|nr:unnamed protein product [Paramecium pentaurelia]